MTIKLMKNWAESIVRPCGVVVVRKKSVLGRYRIRSSNVIEGSMPGASEKSTFGAADTDDGFVGGENGELGGFTVDV
jgi:hypothetical protein